MITYTQFFTDSMAATLSQALSAAGLSFPVTGQVTDAAADDDRIEVRIVGTEEIIPGNLTLRLDGSIDLMLHTADSANAADAQQKAAQVGGVVLEVLRREWRRVPLPHPQPGTDPAYEADPFLVLDLIADPQSVTCEDGAWHFSTDFRAYVQF